MGTRAHPPVTDRVQVADVGDRSASGVEELLGSVAAQPAHEDVAVTLVLTRVREWHLVGVPIALDSLAIDLLRPGPALGAPEHDHRPGRAVVERARACPTLDLMDL